MKERRPNRLKEYDYSSDNLYFITSCVHNRICCFGEIVVRTGRDLSVNNDDMASVVGTGRDLSLQQNVDPSIQNDEMASVRTGRDPSIQNDDMAPVPSYIPQMILNKYGKIAKKQWRWLGDQYSYVVLHEFVIMPNHIHGIIEINRSRIVSSNPIKIKSLSELMGAYKTTVSKQIHLSGFTEFMWQRSFHEHIIRNEKSFKTISEYIINNPLNWKQDKFYNL